MTEEKKKSKFVKFFLKLTPGIVSAIFFIIGIAAIFIWTKKAFGVQSQAVLFTGAIGAPALILLIRALIYKKFAAWLGDEYGVEEDFDLE